MKNLVILGDSKNVLNIIKNIEIDLVLTDPPYELGSFRKKIGKWEKENITDSDIFKECNRLLKNGGHCLCFAANRTVHKFGYAIENSGFEMRDTLIWKYNQSIPRNMNLSKAIDAQTIYGKTSSKYLKMVEQEYGGEEYTVKGTNNTMFGDKVIFNRKEYTPITDVAKKYDGWGTNLAPSFEPIIMARKKFVGSLAENIILNNVGGINIDKLKKYTDKYPSNILEFEKEKKDNFNTHPTVKPVNLLKYLIEMTTQEKATVIDPFAGSGSTAVACVETNRNFIVIEREKEYFDIILKRLNNRNVDFDVITEEEVEEYMLNILPN